MSLCVIRRLLAIGCLSALPVSQLAAQESSVLVPERVFDGTVLHTGWEVVVAGRAIAAAGPRGTIQRPSGARVIELGGATLLPGLIEGIPTCCSIPTTRPVGTTKCCGSRSLSASRGRS